MINLTLTVREAMELSTNCSRDIYEKIMNAFEQGLGVPNLRIVNITRMTTDHRIPCIKVIRNALGWGLKESKDWTDVVVGRFDYDTNTYVGGKSNSIALNTPEKAERLLRDLTTLGCEGYLS
jgi:hypothetical protein